MASRICIFIGVLAFSLVSCEITASNSNQLESTVASSTSCGGTLNGYSGTISYKNFDTVQANERCVWIIRAPLAQNFTVRVTSMFRQSGSSALIYYGFGLNETVSKVVDYESTSIVSGSVLMVTYFTTYSSPRGFTLRYSAEIDPSQLSSNGTIDGSVLSANSGLTQFSVNDFETHVTNKISVLVYTPIRNQSGSFQKTELVYMRDAPEQGTCFSVVDVYKFSMENYMNKWSYFGEICGDVASDVITASDLILLVFRNVAKGGPSGYHLYATSRSNTNRR